MAYLQSPQFVINDTLLGKCTKAKYVLDGRAVHLLLLRENVIALTLFCYAPKNLIFLNLKDVIHACGMVVRNIQT